MMWGEWGTEHWGWMLFGGIHMILVWALIILLIAALIKWLSGSKEPPTGRKDALEILNERYARGEIDRDTYQEMKRELQRAD
ncbi:SHOCT domain-containing protein [Marinobacterium sp. D7]|uniref:SHOCT domain-containing protein n=1 Tax=Marinobacterium ramblicola TaxID=2849041 RepID=UPI001C2D647B|nr:SHOCT domain-containing protein [Marinobacterium ramblicola]MBV1788070.1 SHOCT domain-containing protein [Marinobacterium ramblicola]